MTENGDENGESDELEARKQGLADVMGTPGGSDSGDEQAHSGATSGVTTTPDRTPPDAGGSQQDAASAPDDAGGPAFDYSPDLQQSIYPRESTWQDFQAFVKRVQSDAQLEHDLEDVQGREVHDAVLQVAIANRAEVLEQIESERM